MINDEVHNTSVLDYYYYDSEAEAYRALHLYYDSSGKGLSFPYHDEFLEAHHLTGILTDVKTKIMNFK